MASVNVDKLSLKELLDLEGKLERAIARGSRTRTWRAQTRLGGIRREARLLTERAFRGRGKGKTSVAKYANPDDRSQTWTGRGRKPNWLIAKVKKGAKLEDLEI